MANGFLLRSLPFTSASMFPLEAGTDGAFVANDFMGMVARAANSSTHMVLRADLGAPVLIDTFVALNAVCDGEVELQASAVDDFAVIGLSLNITPTHGEVASKLGRLHPAYIGAAVGPFRYWRVIVYPYGGRVPEIARLLLGGRYQPARNFSFGVSRGAEDLGEVEHSPRGATFRRRARKLRTLGLSWQMLTQAEAEGFSLPLLEEVGNTEFLLACLDPAPHAQRSRRMYFGNLKGDLSLNWRAHDLFEKRLQMQSVI